MWNKNWREDIWKQIDIPWDMIVIGGGITGAGILRESVRSGLKVLLVEQNDFSWGTSSRSSKLVHGGLRYLREGKIRLIRDCVHERELLLQEGPGLIDPLGFLLTVHRGDFPGRWTYQFGLSVYDLLALRWDHKYYDNQDFQMLAPHITDSGLKGGFRYGDAQTDDARLVLRVIQEAIADGGTAINYVKAVNLLRKNSRVTGVSLLDKVTDATAEVQGRIIVNATGAWADHLRQQIGAPARIRPLRGSHLIFSAWRLPVAQAVSFLHPLDRRPVFIFPWEGVTLVGTTDFDHAQVLDADPMISPAEVAYLMAAVEYQFPTLGISLSDVISTFAGVRPVIGTGKPDPSQESRDHVVWHEDGLLTVTGGKLTTFRRIALDAIRAVKGEFPELGELHDDEPVLNKIDLELPEAPGLNAEARKRLLGRYGTDAFELIRTSMPGELENIPNTEAMWAELRWAARSEAVVHLEDLLFRRVRLGLLLPHGAADHMQRIRSICQEVLGWDDDRWSCEQAAYLHLWEEAYSLPNVDEIPDWKLLLEAAYHERMIAIPARRRKIARASLLAGFIPVIALLILWVYRAIERRQDPPSIPSESNQFLELPCPKT
jgi:glycerol-3-phosphate dehydrogenase